MSKLTYLEELCQYTCWWLQRLRYYGFWRGVRVQGTTKDNCGHFSIDWTSQGKGTKLQTWKSVSQKSTYSTGGDIFLEITSIRSYTSWAQYRWCRNKKQKTQCWCQEVWFQQHIFQSVFESKFPFLIPTLKYFSSRIHLVGPRSAARTPHFNAHTILSLLQAPLQVPHSTLLLVVLDFSQMFRKGALVPLAVWKIPTLPMPIKKTTREGEEATQMVSGTAERIIYWSLYPTRASDHPPVPARCPLTNQGRSASMTSTRLWQGEDECVMWLQLELLKLWKGLWRVCQNRSSSRCLWIFEQSLILARSM